MNNNAPYHEFFVKINKLHLDSFGHVNNATYLQLFEQARWDIINKGGYGLEKIQSSGLGPTVLEVTVKYLKELLLDDEIIIQSRFLAYKGKIGKLAQSMIRNGIVCCEAEYKVGLFSLRERKLVRPTEEWLKALDLN